MSKNKKKPAAKPAAAVNPAPAQMAPITNPAVDAAIKALKEGPSPEKQIALSEALKTARLLAPCAFDVDVKPEPGKPVQIQPTQIKFFLVNTKDGRTFFPAFTDVDKSTKIQFVKDTKATEVVRTMQDFEMLMSQPGNKASGIVINPGTDDIIVPRAMIARLCGKEVVAPTPAPNPIPPAPVQVTFTEPSIYPTRMINAVYDRCCQVPEISRVWLKQKMAGKEVSFFFVVESDVQEERVLNEIREVSVPLARDVKVEVVFTTEQIQKLVIKESTALYDRELEL